MPGGRSRGLSVSYTHLLKKDVTYEEVKAVYDKYYNDEFFVRVLNKDVCPQTRWVEGSNFVDVNFKIDPRTKRIIMMGAMDNLVKGCLLYTSKGLNGMKADDAVETVLNLFARTKNNEEFVQDVKKTRFF